jgi:hypothetical protein
VPTDRYSEIMSPIARSAGVPLRPASAESIDTLRKFDFPPDAIQFYSRYEPADCLEGPRGVRLWPVRDIVVGKDIKGSFKDMTPTRPYL